MNKASLHRSWERREERCTSNTLIIAPNWRVLLYTDIIIYCNSLEDRTAGTEDELTVVTGPAAVSAHG